MAYRRYWDFYRSIEDDLIAASRYVELVKSNFRCYSVEFSRILIAAGSELDMVFKELCEKISPGKDPKNIKGYYPIITSKFKDFVKIKRNVRNYEIPLQPFRTWTPEKSPSWWGKGFDEVKHKRNVAFGEANLKNTLNAVAGLSIALYRYYLLVEGEKGEFAFVDLPRLMVPVTKTNQDLYPTPLLMSWER